MLWVNQVYVDTKINGQSHGRTFYLILINANTPLLLWEQHITGSQENAVWTYYCMLFTVSCKMLDMAGWWSAPASFTLLFPSQVSDEKEMLLFSQLCDKPSLSQLLLCSLEEAIDFQGSLCSNCRISFHNINKGIESKHSWGGGSLFFPLLFSYVTLPTCSRAGTLEHK